jgi:hypothetical protein
MSCCERSHKPVIRGDCQANWKPVSVSGRAVLRLVFPAFCSPNHWAGASIALIYYPVVLSSVNAFVVPNLSKFRTSNYVLAVVNTDGKIYKFWENVGEVLHYPLYNNETLFNGCVFKVYNTISAASTFEGQEFTIEIKAAACDNVSVEYTIEANKKFWLQLCTQNGYYAYSNTYNLPMQFQLEQDC